ncbi:DUF11 domain-containing protein [Romboutsia weinsteinii]|uniref:DUF11 domain-containing protein n=1 Tax=Romboutsia weinsteinii TaxID=2020949 RepID=A0A371J9C4_9FIRM|nr:DUF11 domain-containing protein [Romboutsia weinsteinii]RDY29361.1 DUF11 domain-containing protein [Romboutsia weinsteinii]
MATKIINNVAQCSYAYTLASDIVTNTILSNTVTTNVDMADILIYKSSSSKYLGKDEELSYTITVVNNTDIDAKGVVITDVLQNGCTYLKNSMDVLINKTNSTNNIDYINTSSNSSINVNILLLSARSVATISFKASPPSSIYPGIIVNNIANALYNSVTTPSNIVSTTYNYAVVEINKIVDKKGKTNIQCNDNMDYQIIIQNKGNVPVINLKVSDKIDDLFNIYPTSLTQNIKINGSLIDGTNVSASIVDSVLYINGISVPAKISEVIPTTTITIQGKINC